MRKMMLVLLLICVSAACTAQGALTYGTSNYLKNKGHVFADNYLLDPIYRNMNEVEGLINAVAGTATASKALIMNSSNQLDTLRLTGALRLLESSGATYYTLIQAGNQGANITYTFPTADSTGTQYLASNGSGTLSWGSPSATFTGGNITSDVTLNADGVDILPTTTTAHTWSIQARDIDGAVYRDVLRWTNGNTPAVLLGDAADSFALASTGLNVTTAGAVTGVSDLTMSGALSAGSWAIGAGAFSTTGATTLGDGTSTVAIASTGMDVTTGGAVSNVTTLGMSGDLTNSGGDILLATTKGVKGSTTTAQTVGIYGYDVDGAAYVGALVVTNGNTPASVMGNANGTSAITSSDWAISTAGVATGLGAITADGLFTGSAGATVTGATVNLNASSNFAVNVGTGTSTGAIGIGGGQATQAITVGSAIVGATPLTFEGATDNGFETIFAITDTTSADKTVTFADVSGTVMLSTLATNGPDIASSVTGGTSQLIYEGTTANTEETIITATDPTADIIWTLPDALTQTVAFMSSTLATNMPQIASSVWGGTNQLIFEGTTANTEEAIIAVTDPTADTIWTIPVAAAGTYSFMSSTLATNALDILNSVWGGTNQLIFEGATANDFETIITPTDATADRTVTIPDLSGTLAYIVKVVTNDPNGKTLTIAESGSVQTNAGAVGAAAWTLPEASTAIGVHYNFIVMAAQELRVTPAGGDVININGTAAAAAEYWTANLAGESLHLIAVDAANWIAISYTGTWTEATPP